MLHRRELRGLSLAPLPYAGLLLLADLPTLFNGHMPGSSRALSAGVLLLLTYGPVLVLGLPSHLLLRRLGRCGLAYYLLAGFGGGLVLGLAVYAAQGWLFPYDPQRNPFAIRFPPQIAIVAAVLALLPAAIFWLVSVRRPPA